jgi:hypothetical protein
MQEEIKHIYFHNDTKLPVMIDSWVDGSNILYCRKIEAGEKKIVHSSVGEWHLNIMFPDNNDYSLWKENEPEFHGNLLGKFRSKPCVFGNYSWMEYDEPFYCDFNTIEPDENNISGLIRFYKKT